MSTLIVTLSAPGSASHELDYCLASAAHTISSHGSAALALLPRADDTALLLPASAVSWQRVSLPKLSRSTSAHKLRAVLDGVVEDQLLDDTSALHLATYRPATDTDSKAVWLAACDKAWLAQHLHSLQAAGHRVSAILPMAFPLAESGAVRAHISGSPDAATITVAEASGVLCLPLAQARTVWPTLGSDDHATLTAEPAVAAAAEAALDSKVTIVQSAQHALHAVLEARSYGVNLAQGDLAVAGSGRWLQQAGTVLRDLASAPAWRAARIGLVLLVVVQMLGLNAWAWKERSALAAKRQQTSQLLTTTFPQVKVVVDAPVQMQREVATLRHSSGALGQRDFESLYARFSAAAQLNSAPTAIDFVAGELTIKGSGLGAAQLSGLQAKLLGAGLQARAEADRIVISLAASPRAGGLQ